MTLFCPSLISTQQCFPFFVQHQCSAVCFFFVINRFWMCTVQCTPDIAAVFYGAECWDLDFDEVFMTCATDVAALLVSKYQMNETTWATCFLQLAGSLSASDWTNHDHPYLVSKKGNGLIGLVPLQNEHGDSKNFAVQFGVICYGTAMHGLLL